MGISYNGWASAGANGGQSWATASGERASAKADGEQAWASAGETSPVVVAPSVEELVADVWPHYPYSHGRLRVEATLSMGQDDATQTDALKENFTH